MATGPRQRLNLAKFVYTPFVSPDLTLTPQAAKELTVVKRAVDETMAGVTAGGVAFTPAGGLAATDVQAALEELDTEKASSSGVTAGLAGKVTGPAAATNNALALFNGTTGKLVQDSATTLDTDGALASNSDQRVPTQKAVKAYVDQPRYGRMFLLMGA